MCQWHGKRCFGKRPVHLSICDISLLDYHRFAASLSTSLFVSRHFFYIFFFSESETPINQRRRVSFTFFSISLQSPFPSLPPILPFFTSNKCHPTAVCTTQIPRTPWTRIRCPSTSGPCLRHYPLRHHTIKGKDRTRTSQLQLTQAQESIRPQSHPHQTKSTKTTTL